MCSASGFTNARVTWIGLAPSEPRSRDRSDGRGRTARRLALPSQAGAGDALQFRDAGIGFGAWISEVGRVAAVPAAIGHDGAACVELGLPPGSWAELQLLDRGWVAMRVCDRNPADLRIWFRGQAVTLEAVRTVARTVEALGNDFWRYLVSAEGNCERAWKPFDDLAAARSFMSRWAVSRHQPDADRTWSDRPGGRPHVTSSSRTRSNGSFPT
jgi:hypothetical protein